MQLLPGHSLVHTRDMQGPEGGQILGEGGGRGETVFNADKRR